MLAQVATVDGLDVVALIESVKSGNGWVIAGAVVSLLTWGLRKGILNRLPWPGVVKWMHDNPLIAMATPFVVSAIGGVVAKFAAGAPLTLAMFAMTVLKVGGAAIVSFLGAKTVLEAREAGKAAAIAAGAVSPAVALAEPPKP